ncbi:uncharacterized protein [Ptychodera flava]|uniref:uncharacterized protein n=1 Tax=Ptychodera flava TaxID=63121 RepID=UPI00396A65AE
MAEGTCDRTLEKIGRDFLTCHLCLSYYTNAKSLPCLHSYCEECLVTLVEKRGELVCPECRQRCNVPKDGVSRLRTNFVLNGLSDLIRAQEIHATDSRSSQCDSCGAMNIDQNRRKYFTSFPTFRNLIAIGENTAVDRDRITFPCSQPVNETDKNTVNQERTVYVPMTTRSKIPKYTVVGENITISVTTNDMNGVPAPTTFLQAVNVTIEGPNGDRRSNVVATDNSATHTVHVTLEEAGTHSISVTVGNTPIPGSPFAVAVLSGSNLAALLRQDTKVVRGKDWRWGDQDGYSTGYIGQDIGNGYVTVDWNNGNSTNDFGLGNIHYDERTMSISLKYRLGAGGKYDLKPQGYY